MFFAGFPKRTLRPRVSVSIEGDEDIGAIEAVKEEVVKRLAVARYGSSHRAGPGVRFLIVGR